MPYISSMKNIITFILSFITLIGRGFDCLIFIFIFVVFFEIMGVFYGFDWYGQAWSARSERFPITLIYGYNF